MIIVKINDEIITKISDIEFAEHSKMVLTMDKPDTLSYWHYNEGDELEDVIIRYMPDRTRYIELSKKSREVTQALRGSNGPRI